MNVTIDQLRDGVREIDCQVQSTRRDITALARGALALLAAGGSATADAGDMLRMIVERVEACENVVSGEAANLGAPFVSGEATGGAR